MPALTTACADSDLFAETIAKPNEPPDAGNDSMRSLLTTVEGISIHRVGSYYYDKLHELGVGR